MKKLFLFVAFAVLFIGCGKKEKGIITIQNNSSHTVVVEFSQNYSSRTITITSNASVNCPWETYFHCNIKEPNANIIKRSETKDKIIISDNDSLKSYTIVNGLCDLTILDKQQFILSDGSKSTNKLILTQGTTTIKTFKYLSRENIVFDKGNTITINDKTYDQITKVGESYLLYENIGDKLVISEIKINITGNTITIYK